MKQRTILLVDDDPDLRHNLEITLEEEGYIIKHADNGAKAVEIINSIPIDLVILDKQMVGIDKKFSPDAGIDLLKWIKIEHPEVYVIMLTGTATIESTIDALELKVSRYFEKESLSSKDLITSVKDAIRVNDDLIIHYGSGTKLAKDEDEELLRKLFFNSSEIKVSLIAKGSRGSSIYRVTSRDRDGSWRVPFATKISWKDQISLEFNKYHKWVEHRLAGGRYSIIIGEPAYTFRRGGMNLSFLNTELDGLQEFRLFYHNSNTQDVLEAISNLFESTLSYWYTTKELEPLLLIKQYSEYLNVEKWDLKHHMTRYLKEIVDNSIIELEDFGISFRNPIDHFEKMLRSPHDIEKRTYVSITHGDLHASNILVDNRNNCWLIDFTSTGRSHILRDFVELESAIKFNVLLSENIKDLIDLESALLSQEDFELITKFSHKDKDIQKAFDCIMKIRELAYLAIAPNRDMDEYYIGLLFHSLNMLRFLPSAVSMNKKISILFSASRILKHFNATI